jgi:phenylpropionate dioxygenase-like ring-hydroxylating dioxygenase large terminal subunit
MFRGFANVWTIIGSSRELRGAPLPVQVAGERLVLFRDGEGKASALVDRCPHRGVKLSLGKVAGGCLECPFHGWKFAGDGSNTHVPWNPDARRERLGATAVPVRELGGLLWLYTAPGADAPGEPDVPDVLRRGDLSVTTCATTWDVHWTRAMENMLDWPHLPFVHARTIGRGMPFRPDSRMEIRWEDRPWGGHSTIAIDGAAQEGALDFRAPNAMHLHISTGKRTFELMSVCLPVDELRTRMIFITIRSFLKSRLFDRLFHYGNRRIGGEDREIVESSQPGEVPPAGDERSVRTDEPTLKFRKLYHGRLRDSVAEVPGRLVALGRPVAP